MAGSIRRPLALAAVVASVACAGAAEQAAAAATGESAKAVRSYWTPSRMRSAQPAGLVPTATSTSQKRSHSLHHEVRHTRRFPARTHGKVFFTQGGVDYVCSGTAIDAPSHSLVITAGHCVCDPTALGNCMFASKWEFVPGYRRGHKPFGEWPADKLAATSKWRHSGQISLGGIDINGDVRYDVGAATVKRHNGKSLQRRIGAIGIAFNQPRDQRYHPFGYPAEPPPQKFNGRHLFRCDSPYRGADHNPGKPYPLRIACDMTGGASGGGWVIKGGSIASVTSYKYVGRDNRLYGPFFGPVIRRFYHSVRND